MITALLIYLLKGSLVLAIGYLFYAWALRRHTHFSLNRWVLLLQIPLVCLLPLAQLPQAWHPFAGESDLATLAVQSISPPTSTQSPTIHDSLPVAAPDTPFNFDPIILLTGIYGTGLFFFFVRLMLQFISLAHLRRRASHIEKHPTYQLIWCEDQIGPFSFFRQIFLPHKGLDAEAVWQVVAHEQIHIQQKHSWDMLLAEMLIVIYWFNPFAWLYRRAIENNLEFLTDRVMLQSGVVRKKYMYQLLTLGFPEWKGRLGISYNQSLLQQRIAMMNTQTSSRWSRWSYVIWLLIMPLFMFCNEPAALELGAISERNQLLSAIIITEDATPAALEKLQKQVADPDQKRELIIEDLTYNPQGKIATIKTTLRSGNASGSTSHGFNAPSTLIPIYFTFTHELLSAGHLREEDLDRLIGRYHETHIFTAGMNNKPATLQSYYPTLRSLTETAYQEYKEKLKQNGWQMETSDSSTYTQIDSSKMEDVEIRIGQFDAKEVWYIVDGGEKQAAFPPIPFNQIREIEVKHIRIFYYIPETVTVATQAPKETLVYIRTK